MSVQSWQTTSSGMAVAVYQPASADCPGDGDPTPCSEKDFGDEELQAIMESLDEQGILQDLMDDSNATSNQSDRREQGGWIVQNNDGTIDIVRFHEVPGADIEYRNTGIRGTRPDHMPDNAIARIHTHPFKHGEALADTLLIKELYSAEAIDEMGGLSELVSDEPGTLTLRANTEPSFLDKRSASRIAEMRAQQGKSDLYHVIIDKEKIILHEASVSDDGEVLMDNREYFDICGS